MNEDKDHDPRTDPDATIDASSLSAATGGSVPADVPGSTKAGGGNQSSPGTASDRFSPGQRFGPYLIERLLGKGGMGEVFEAENTETGHRVALKVLSRESDWSPSRRRRFLQEGNVAASISDPHSLYVYGTDEIDGTPVIAMELALGGTLKDRVESKGSLPIKEAVEAAIEILEGLAAAHRTGILHRDVKPANCFIDSAGTVKIGDYGLSLPTSDTEATRLTMTGTLLGTPSFAPPEQLRGAKIDHRADIYAVGATLFYLLTGRVPFTGGDALQAVVATLEQPAPNPRRHRPEIPAGLADVILRCLEKDPSARYQSCDELQAALAGYGVRAPRVASTGKRILAGALDTGLLQIFMMLVLTPVLPKIIMSGRSDLQLAQLLMNIPLLLYPAITESVFGATLGKAVFGIRVAESGGRPPGFLRSLLRSGLFWALPLAAETLSVIALDPMDTASMLRPAALGLGLLQTFGWIWVFLPSLRGRGNAGLHDTWTHTGVFQRALRARRTGQPAESIPAEVSSGGWSIGPYRVDSDPAGLSPGAVISGIDASLRRRVWIRICHSMTPAVSPQRRALSRQGRLRWLNGRRAADLSWDAYEAIEGIPLLQAGPQPWGSVRLWLSELTDEIMVWQNGDADPLVLSLDRVWLASSGRAVLLEFPAPGWTSAPSDRSAPVIDARNPRDVQEFLFSAAAATGAANILSQTPELGRSVLAPSIPLPLHASRLLQDLRNRRFESMQAMDETLTSIRDHDPRVRRSRIGVKLLLIWVPPLLFAAGLGFTYAQVMSLEARRPDLRAADWCLGELARMRTASTPEKVTRREALEVYLAGPLRSALGDTATQMFAQGGGAIGSRRWISAESARRWAEVVASRPEPSANEVTRAAALLRPQMRHDDRVAPFELTFAIAMVLLAATGLLSILLAGILRGGLLLRAFGIVVVRRDGTEVGRLRALARAVISWSPVLVFWVIPVVFHMRPFVKLFCDLSSPTFVIPWVLIVVGVAWALLRPERGIADRLAGTYLVPR